MWGVINDFGSGTTLEKAEAEMTSDVASVSHLCKPNMWGIFGSNILDLDFKLFLLK